MNLPLNSSKSRLKKTALLTFLLSPTRLLAFVLQKGATSGCPSFRSVCFGQQVGTTFVLRSDEDSSQSSGSRGSAQKEEISRPERKALERARKHNRSNQNHRKHNYAGRKNELQGSRQPGEGRYDLHSKALPTLNENSSANDVMRAIKRAQNLHDAHDLRAVELFLLEQTDDSFAYGFRGSLLARLAVAALHMNNHELALKALEERRTKHQASILPLESAAIIRGLLRVHNCSDAQQVLQDELSLPELGASVDDVSSRELIKHRALSLASIISRHFYEGEPLEAILACGQLAAMGQWVREAGLSAEEIGMPWLRLVQGAARCESGRRDGSITLSSEIKVELPCNLVYAVLDAMAAFPSDNDDKLFEALSNALVRRVLFVAGAVDMEGCPPADRGEAAFIGRSNVGKSSLVNMVTNRKSLAFTSKRPGKTQQFNFFAVNDKPGKEKEIKYGDVVEGEKDSDSLYLVDLPGFGFAKAPQEIRQQWAALMREYIANRKSLRVLFHLVDARHGLVDEDTTIMKQVGESLRPGVSYVVVLTKADKNVNGASSRNPGKVSREVLKKLRETMVECGVGSAPVVLTSAETKLGRDGVWRHLRRAAEF